MKALAGRGIFASLVAVLGWVLFETAEGVTEEARGNSIHSGMAPWICLNLFNGKQVRQPRRILLVDVYLTNIGTAWGTDCLMVSLRYRVMVKGSHLTYTLVEDMQVK
jgi:hypothetical protein